MVSLDDFNWEVNLFLKNLTAFKNTSKEVNTVTLELLDKVLTNVEEFVSGVQVNADENPRLPFQIDETHFEFRHLIFCRLCGYQVGPTKEEYIVHVSGERHNTLFANYINDQYAFGTVNSDDQIPAPVNPTNKYSARSVPSKEPGIPRNEDKRENERGNTTGARMNDRHRSRNNSYNSYDEPTRNDSEIPHWQDRGGQKGNRPRSTSNCSRTNRSNAFNRSNINNNDTCKSINNNNYAENRRSIPARTTSPTKSTNNISVDIPNVFDDNIYDFIEQQQQTGQQQRRSSLPSATANNPPNRNDVPPYMMNSLFLNRLGQGREQRAEKPTPATKIDRPVPAAKIGRPMPAAKNDRPRTAINRSNSYSSDDAAEIKPVPAYALNKLKQDREKYQVGKNEVTSSTKPVLKPNLNNSASVDDKNKKISAILSNLESKENSASNGNPPIEVSKGAIPKRPTTTSQSIPRSETPIEQKSKIELPIPQNFSIEKAERIIDEQAEKGAHLKELPVYKQIVGSLENILRTKYPSAKCHLFGSRLLGVANEQSELDIHIDLLESFNVSKSKAAIAEAAKYTENALTKSSTWSGVRVITDRPMIRIFAVHNLSEMHCNLSFGIHGTGVAIYTTRLIAHLFDIHETCRRIVIWMQHWFKNGSLPKFSGYLMTLLVIFYFQMRKKLPSIKSMQINSTKKRCGENFVEFKLLAKYTEENVNLLDILIDFCQFYATFNFETNIISVFEGKCVEHSICHQDDGELSPELYRFKSFVIEAPRIWNVKIPCVQDIFVHRNNVGVNVSSSELKEFREYCKESMYIFRTQKNNGVSEEPTQKQLSDSNVKLLQEFFIREISPVLYYQMGEGERLRDLPVYPQIVADIEDALRGKYPTVKCHLYGSRILGVANEQSKLDIFVDLLKSFDTSRTTGAVLAAAEEAEKILRKSSTWSNLKVIARHPMIRLLALHNDTQLKCNISFGIQGTGVCVHTTRLIRSLFDIQEACRQTVIWILLWFRVLPSEQMKTFNSYVITLLVIFYFQMKNKLPSIEEMQDEKQMRIKCGENAVGFAIPKSFPVWSDRFRDILTGFFQFYATFKFKRDIVSVFEGKPIRFSIREMSDDELSNTQRRFKSFLVVHKHNWNEDKLCVQDIFVHKNNVGDAIHPDDLRRFQTYCKESVAILQSPEAALLRY